MERIAKLMADAAPLHAPHDIIDSALETVRRHLRMEVAYLSEFVGDEVVFRAVSAPGLEDLVKPGDTRSVDQVYCRHIIAGDLPRLIRDTADHSFAQTMPITTQLPIGSHVSVPIRRDDGSIYGMFCCLSPRPNPTLNDRDLEVMELFAELSSRQVNRSLLDRARRGTIEASTRDMIDEGLFRVVYQPIVNLATGETVGFESLCRFPGEPYRSPDIWFAEAAEVGLGEELEIAVAARALIALPLLPEPLYLSVNCAPETLASGAISRLLSGCDQSRVVVEITEHASVADYDAMLKELALLHDRGVRIAIDDAGAGYSGLQHILRLKPDIIKLDMALTRSIDTDYARRSLAEALSGFARETGAKLIAEGIETRGEADTLREIGVALGQGFLLGRPDTLGAALGRLTVAPAARLLA